MRSLGPVFFAINIGFGVYHALVSNAATAAFSFSIAALVLGLMVDRLGKRS